MLCSVPTPIVPLIKKVCAVSPLMLRSVPTQIDPINKKVCAVSPQMLFGVHTPIVPLIKTVCAVSLLPVYILSVRCSLHPNVIYAFVTLGSVLDSKQSRKSGKFQLARWSHRLASFSVLLGPSWIINLAQFVSPSMALQAELLFSCGVTLLSWVGLMVGL